MSSIEIFVYPNDVGRQLGAVQVERYLALLSCENSEAGFVAAKSFLQGKRRAHKYTLGCIAGQLHSNLGGSDCLGAP